MQSPLLLASLVPQTSLRSYNRPTTVYNQADPRTNSGRRGFSGLEDIARTNSVADARSIQYLFHSPPLHHTHTHTHHTHSPPPPSRPPSAPPLQNFVTWSTAILRWSVHAGCDVCSPSMTSPQRRSPYQLTSSQSPNHDEKIARRRILLPISGRKLPPACFRYRGSEFPIGGSLDMARLLWT